MILDVSATPEGRGHQHRDRPPRARRCSSIPLTVGGGVRTVEDALAPARGRRRQGLGQHRGRRSGRSCSREIAERFGRQCCVLAIDAAWRDGRFEVLVKGGREGTGIDALRLGARGRRARGAGEMLLTSWDRDGTRSGYDLELTRAVRARGACAGDRLGRRRPARAHLARRSRPAPMRCSPPRSSTTATSRVADVKLYLQEHGIRVRP